MAIEDDCRGGCANRLLPTGPWHKGLYNFRIAHRPRPPHPLRLFDSIAHCLAFGALVLSSCATYRDFDARMPDSSHLERARIIYIGEKHNEASHHRFEEEVIRRLHRQGTPLALGMEMVDVTQQPALDDYLAKKTSWSEFERRTGFDRGWGATSPAYRRILAWCRKQGVPVIALNAPPAVTRKLARNEPLTVAESRLVPNYPEPPGGFEQFRAAMAAHGNGHSLRHYYEAQRAWDQTMAGRILAWLPNHQGTLVVLLGRFHADPRTGVPWYVARNSCVSQLILFPESSTPAAKGPAPTDQASIDCRLTHSVRQLSLRR